MPGTYLPLYSDGVNGLVDDGECLHYLRLHFGWVRLRVGVDLEVKARIVAVSVVIVGIHCSNAELVPAT